METFVTVLAALLVASPLIVLALRTTRWDPVVPPTVRRVYDERDADARRAATDAAALVAHQVDAQPQTPRDADAAPRPAVAPARHVVSSGTRRAQGASRPGAPRLG